MLVGVLGVFQEVNFGATGLVVDKCYGGHSIEVQVLVYFFCVVNVECEEVNVVVCVGNVLLVFL